MISQIFQYLTRKQVNNSLTLIPDKSSQELFMEQRNISNISAHMYNSILASNKPPYQLFRDSVHHHMQKWIWKQAMPADDVNNNYERYVLKRLNNNFLKEFNYLIEKPNVVYVNAPKVKGVNKAGSQINTPNEMEQQYNIIIDKNNNVYKEKFKVVSRDNNDNIVQSYKNGGDIMACDYQNMDVWKKQETYADFNFEKWRSFRDGYGYAGTYIPRNVDRNPDSFGLTHRNPERASLSDAPRAYDNSEYYRAKGIK